MSNQDPVGPGADTLDPARWQRFVSLACPDHGIRGARHHVLAQAEARALLAAHPAIADAGIVADVVLGRLDRVRAALARDPALAAGSHGPKQWTLLLYLCFTRLADPAVTANAPAIAEALLDAGADPNAWFPAGDSRYTPLVGATGEGEEDRPPHPARDALVEVLLSRGAEPYDVQVFYNLHFRGPMLWWLRQVHAHAMRRGRAEDWTDGEWRMIDMTPYGFGARWHFDRAIRRGDTELVAWILAHGASPHAAPARDPRQPRGTVLDWAYELGRDEIITLLEAHGAVRSAPASRGLDARRARIEAFTSAAMRLDRGAAERLLAEDVSLRREARPLMLAAETDRADVITLLLDLGVSADLADHARGEQRALHVAAYAGAARATAALLAGGASPDPRDAAYGATPLGFATYAQQRAVIDLLVPVSRDVDNLRINGATDRLRALGASPA